MLARLAIIGVLALAATGLATTESEFAEPDGSASTEVVEERALPPPMPPIPPGAPVQFPGLRQDTHEYHVATGKVEPCQKVCTHKHTMPCGDECVDRRNGRVCDKIHGEAGWKHELCLKVCMTGKPCGNDCIDADKECDQIHGRACAPFGDPWPHVIAKFYNDCDDCPDEKEEL